MSSAGRRLESYFLTSTYTKRTRQVCQLIIKSSTIYRIESPFVSHPIDWSNAIYARKLCDSWCHAAALRPRLHEQIKLSLFAQILDPYEITPDEFAQIKLVLFALVNAALIELLVASSAEWFITRNTHGANRFCTRKNYKNCKNLNFNIFIIIYFPIFSRATWAWVTFGKM